MEQKTDIRSVEEVVAALGRDLMVRDLGHTPQVISRAVTENIMPAHWFVGVRDMAAQRGIEVPESLFRWARKSPNNTQIVNNKQDRRGWGNPDHGRGA